MTTGDFWNLIAVEKFGCADGWQWVTLEALGDGLPREKAISQVTGARYSTVLKSGPRKGRPNFKKPDPGTERTFCITFGDFDVYCLEWEQREGKCHKCWGRGSDPWGTCGRCCGSGLGVKP